MGTQMRNLAVGLVAEVGGIVAGGGPDIERVCQNRGHQR